MTELAIYEQKPWRHFYPDGLLSEMDIPVRTMNEAFNRACDKFKDKTAIIFYGRKISYDELRKNVNDLAAALSQLGVKKGDRVGVLLLNSPEFIISFHAILKLGATCTPMSPVYSSPEIKHQLTDSETDTLICQNLLWEKVHKTGIELKNVIFADISDFLPTFKKLFGKSVLRAVYQKRALSELHLPEGPGFFSFKKLLNDKHSDIPDIDIDPIEDVAIQPYTGGTTGLPKGVMVTHHNLLCADILFNAFYSFNEGNETIISYMPFFHIGGLLWSVVICVIRGWTQVILTTPQVDDILNSIVSHNVTWFGGAPTIYEMLKDHEKTMIVKWKKLKLVASGADALHEATEKDWEIKTGTKLQNWWGSTETIAGTCTPLKNSKPNSIGIPLPNTLVAILDPEKDEFLPVGEIGELCVIGSQVLKGYWKHPEALIENTAQINGKTWFRSGDLGQMDEDGFFYIYDRKKDLIKYKGLRVHSREVEEVIKAHPQVKEVGVIGIDDLKVGQVVKAFVVLEKDARGKISEMDIIQYCQDKLAHYKIPKIIVFMGELPKTDVGKVSRRELREMEI